MSALEAAFCCSKSSGLKLLSMGLGEESKLTMLICSSSRTGASEKLGGKDSLSAISSGICDSFGVGTVSAMVFFVCATTLSKYSVKSPEFFPISAAAGVAEAGEIGSKVGGAAAGDVDKGADVTEATGVGTKGAESTGEALTGAAEEATIGAGVAAMMGSGSEPTLRVRSMTNSAKESSSGGTVGSILALKKACGGNFSAAGGDEATSAAAVGWTWADFGGDDGFGSTAE